MFTARLLAPLALAAATLAVPVVVTTQSQVLAITGVNVVDVLDGHIVPNSTVIVTGNTITSVTANRTPRGAKVVDGRNKFLIPGLWDMHAHTEGAGESSLQLHVANGVTGIRDMGSDLELILRLRAATASGQLPGPRIVAAGPILDDAPGDWPFRMRVKTARGPRAAERHAAGGHRCRTYQHRALVRGAIVGIVLGRPGISAGAVPSLD